MTLRQVPPTYPIVLPQMPVPEIEQLGNGTALKTLDGADQDIFRLDIVFDGGNVEAGATGLGMLTPDLVTKGCSRYDERSIAESLDFNGAKLTTSSGSHHTAFTLSMLNRNASQILGLLSDMLAGPTFPDKYIDVARNAMVTNLEVMQKRPSFHARRAMSVLVHGQGHPLAREAAGDIDAIKAITRDDISNWYASMANAATCTAFLSGRVDNRLRATVRDFLGHLPLRTGKIGAEYVPDTFAAPQTITLPMPGSLQTAVSVALPAPSRDSADYHLLRLAVMALGGYFGSRLSANIREEKGLTYGISAALIGTPEGAYVMITAECDNRYAPQVVEEICRELARMATEPPCGEELERVKRHIATGILSSTDNATKTMQMYVTEHVVPLPGNYYTQQRHCLSTATPEALAEVAARYLLPSQMRVVMCGNL